MPQLDMNTFRNILVFVISGNTSDAQVRVSWDEFLEDDDSFVKNVYNFKNLDSTIFSNSIIEEATHMAAQFLLHAKVILCPFS